MMKDIHLDSTCSHGYQDYMDINVEKSVNFAYHFSSRFIQNYKNIINLTEESCCSENSSFNN